jgi:hypothetical protein
MRARLLCATKAKIMDEEIERLVVSVRADASAFARDNRWDVSTRCGYWNSG